MKEAIVLFFWGLACAICLTIAGVLVYLAKDGWGWFLFGGIIIFGSLKYKSET